MKSLFNTSRVFGLAILFLGVIGCSPAPDLTLQITSTAPNPNNTVDVSITLTNNGSADYEGPVRMRMHLDDRHFQAVSGSAVTAVSATPSAGVCTGCNWNTGISHTTVANVHSIFNLDVHQSLLATNESQIMNQELLIDSITMAGSSSVVPSIPAGESVALTVTLNQLAASTQLSSPSLCMQLYYEDTDLLPVAPSTTLPNTVVGDNADDYACYKHPLATGSDLAIKLVRASPVSDFTPGATVQYEVSIENVGTNVANIEGPNPPAIGVPVPLGYATIVKSYPVYPYAPANVLTPAGNPGDEPVLLSSPSPVMFDNNICNISYAQQFIRLRQCPYTLNPQETMTWEIDVDIDASATPGALVGLSLNLETGANIGDIDYTNQSATAQAIIQ